MRTSSTILGLIAIVAAVGCGSSRATTDTRTAHSYATVRYTAAPIATQWQSDQPPGGAAIGGGPRSFDTFDPDAVERTIEVNKEDLQDLCYASHADEGPSSFLLVVDVGPDGRATARPEQVNGDPAVASCVANAVRSIDFPRSPGGSATLTMLFQR